jgi:hypothetical protein
MDLEKAPNDLKKGGNEYAGIRQTIETKKYAHVRLL